LSVGDRFTLSGTCVGQHAAWPGSVRAVPFDPAGMARLRCAAAATPARAALPTFCTRRWAASPSMIRNPSKASSP
jgi:hypothetical protein